jgi:hypothetical protein
VENLLQKLYKQQGRIEKQPTIIMVLLNLEKDESIALEQIVRKESIAMPPLKIPLG